MNNKNIKWCLHINIRVIAFCLGKLLSNNSREREVEFITQVEKKALQETGGTGEIQVRKIMFIWNQNIMRKFKWHFNMADKTSG